MGNKKIEIIGLVGPKGSGKGTLAKRLKTKYSARVVTFSDILSDVLEILNIDRTRVNQIYLSVALREQFGYEVLANALKARVDKMKGGAPIVIDGIRFTQDFKPWKNLPNFTLISLDADIKERFNRIKRRSKNNEEKSLTWAKFQKEESMPTEVSFKKLARQAKYQINTNTTLKETYRQLEGIAKNIKL
jgi:dephospho-CoA kinase